MIATNRPAGVFGRRPAENDRVGLLQTSDLDAKRGIGWQFQRGSSRPAASPARSNDAAGRDGSEAFTSNGDGSERDHFHRRALGVAAVSNFEQLRRGGGADRDQLGSGPVRSRRPKATLLAVLAAGERR